MTAEPEGRGPIFIQDAFPPMPICWPALEPAAVNEQFQQLERWVQWLTDRYALDHRTIPYCWPKHGALIEELSALHGAWTASYSQTAAPTAPLDWHASFAAARQRLTDWVARTGCRPGEHR